MESSETTEEQTHTIFSVKYVSFERDRTHTKKKSNNYNIIIINSNNSNKNNVIEIKKNETKNVRVYFFKVSERNAIIST